MSNSRQSPKPSSPSLPSQPSSGDGREGRCPSQTASKLTAKKIRMLEPWSEPFIPPGYVSLGIASLVALVAPLALRPKNKTSSPKISLRKGSIPRMLLGHGVGFTEDEEHFYLVPPMVRVLERAGEMENCPLSPTWQSTA